MERQLRRRGDTSDCIFKGSYIMISRIYLENGAVVRLTRRGNSINRPGWPYCRKDTTRYYVIYITNAYGLDGSDLGRAALGSTDF